MAPHHPEWKQHAVGDSGWSPHSHVLIPYIPSKAQAKLQSSPECQPLPSSLPPAHYAHENGVFLAGFLDWLPLQTGLHKSPGRVSRLRRVKPLTPAWETARVVLQSWQDPILSALQGET